MTEEELNSITIEQLNDELFDKFAERWENIGFGAEVEKLGQCLKNDIAETPRKLAGMFVTRQPLLIVMNYYDNLFTKFEVIEKLNFEIIGISDRLDVTTYFFQGVRSYVNIARAVLNSVLTLKEMMYTLVKQYDSIVKLGCNEEQKNRNIEEFLTTIKPYMKSYSDDIREKGDMFIRYGKQLEKLPSNSEVEEEILHNSGYSTSLNGF